MGIQKQIVAKIKEEQKIVVALSQTIKIMSEIDEIIKFDSGWPIK